jgi:hypothetical protein
VACAFMTSVSACAADVTGPPLAAGALSVTVTLKGNVPAWVGVPDSSPVLFRVSPGGRVPVNA